MVEGTMNLRNALRPMRTMVVALALVVLTTGATAGQSPEPSARFSAKTDRPEQTTLKATAAKDGVRVTTTLREPFIAGKPAFVRTRVRNTRSAPVWWYPGTDGPDLYVSMTEATRRLGQPLRHITPGRIDLKNGLFGGRDRLVYLPFERHRVDGKKWHRYGADVLTPPQRIGPGKVTDFVHRWDGKLHVEDSPGDIGLPPVGPARLGTDCAFHPLPRWRPRQRPHGEDSSGNGGRRWLVGRSSAPAEVVDVAMADPDFADVLAERDFARHSQGMLWWDESEGHWLTGTCTYVADDQPATWHLAAVEPIHRRRWPRSSRASRRDTAEGCRRR